MLRDNNAQAIGNDGNLGVGTLHLKGELERLLDSVDRRHVHILEHLVIAQVGDHDHRVMRQDAGKDRLALSDKLDKVLTNAFFGPLIMLAVLYALFYVTIEVGAYPQGWVEDGCAALGEFFAGIIPEGELQSLVVDGIIGGVGGVLSFAPLIVIMFALIAFLEDSGYMALRLRHTVRE